METSRAVATHRKNDLRSFFHRNRALTFNLPLIRPFGAPSPQGEGSCVVLSRHKGLLSPHNPNLNNQTQKQLQAATSSDHMACVERRPADTPRVPGVQRAAALWCFSPGFSRKAGPCAGSAEIKVASPWIESNCPPDSSTPVGWQPYTWRVTVGVQTVRIVRPHPPSNDC